MSSNKTVPTKADVEKFLQGVEDKRREDAQVLVGIMQEISGEKPTMWGPSIIGFGFKHYRYESGHEGDAPILAFSPRKTSLTIYFEGFDGYLDKLEDLGKHKISEACLYINKLSDIDLKVLRKMLEQSHSVSTKPSVKPTSVEEYILTIPAQARPRFDELREMVKQALPGAEEVVAYGIIGYKIDDKRARVYISGWKDHVSVYPLPKNEDLQGKLAPYIKGAGTLWFGLDEPLQKTLIESTARTLADR